MNYNIMNGVKSAKKGPGGKPSTHRHKPSGKGRTDGGKKK